MNIATFFITVNVAAAIGVLTFFIWCVSGKEESTD